MAALPRMTAMETAFSAVATYNESRGRLWSWRDGDAEHGQLELQVQRQGNELADMLKCWEMC